MIARLGMGPTTAVAASHAWSRSMDVARSACVIRVVADPDCALKMASSVKLNGEGCGPVVRPRSRRVQNVDICTETYGIATDPRNTSSTTNSALSSSA